MRKLVEDILNVCRGRTESITGLSDDRRNWAGIVLVIILASGVYGATIGLWRHPLQGLYTAIKFPLLILLTTAANALLNGMLAQLLGLKMSFRESTFAILCSFAVASVILGSMSPVSLFVLYNTPPLAEGNDTFLSHSVILLTHVGTIAMAGVAGNVRLLQYLRSQCGRRTAAKVLTAWLAGNLFLGCQLSWIMRPFIGAPVLEVQFFRPDAFSGNFYEATFRAVMKLLS